MYSKQTIVGLRGCKTIAPQDTNYEVYSNENHLGSCWMSGQRLLKMHVSGCVELILTELYCN